MSKLLSNVRKERHEARALDSLVDLALVPCWHLCAALAHHACVRGQKLLQVRDVLVVFVEWNWIKNRCDYKL